LCVKKRVAKRIFREKGTKIFSQHLLPPFSCLYDRPTTVTSPVQTNHPTMPSRKSKRSKKALLQFSSGSANDDDVETLTLAVAGGGEQPQQIGGGGSSVLGGLSTALGEGRTKQVFESGNVARINSLLALGQQYYNVGRYADAKQVCEQIYQSDAYRTDNLLILGAIHFQLRNFSESIFYNQQAIRVDPNFAEAYGNLGNALKELGDLEGSIRFYLKAIKLKPRYPDVYNNLASAYMQRGQTTQAQETFQMALILNPNLVDAHSNLGNLLKAQGKLEDAKRCYLEAIRVKPNFSIAWSNLAGIFRDQGDAETAIAYYQEAIRLSPEFADAWSNMGNALKEQGFERMDEAKRAYKRAIELRPDFAIAHGNLASCSYDEGDLKTAIRQYKHALQLEPNFPDAHNNLGNALREVGKGDEAILHYRAALRLKPDHPHAYNNLGNALKDKGMVKEAIHCYMTACRLMPRFAAAHCNLGSILKEQGKVEQAIAHYQQAISIDPMFADAYSNMGNAYNDLSRLEDAIKCYTTAIRLKPAFADAYANLANAYKEGGRVDDAITCYRKALSLRPDFPDAYANLIHALVYICDWRGRSSHFSKLRDILTAQLESTRIMPPAVQPYHALMLSFSGEQQLQLARKYASQTLMNVALLEMPPFRFRAKKPNQRLHVGFVASSFGNHPTGHALCSALTMFDEARFQVTCYSLAADDESMWRRKIETHVEGFKDVSQLMPGDTARLIHSDGVHILVNLNGYTKGARNEIFALKPAPIQISMQGYAGTSGAGYMDYIVADKVTVPPGSPMASYFSEQMLYMPSFCMTNNYKQDAAYVLDRDHCPHRETYCLPEDKFVFANFGQMYKIEPEIFSVWMKILKRVPKSVMWMLKFPALAEANIRAEAKAHGIGPERLIFSDVVPREEHLKRTYLADLCLDTPIFNGQTTATDALWGGTPILTLAVEKMVSRLGASIANAIGIPEMVVKSLEEYEELAVKLAKDTDKLWSIRKKIDANRMSCPLFDTNGWIKDFEQGLTKLWKRYEKGAPAETFDAVVASPREETKETKET
jgi:protein O-GlcNAc transferase